jgi:hypothetical protein
MKMKWNDSHRTLHVFNAKNENWLERNVSIEVSTCLFRFYNLKYVSLLINKNDSNLY